MMAAYKKCNRIKGRDKIAAFLSACLLVSTLLTLPVNATVERSEKKTIKDIFFHTEHHYTDEYRYAIDVVYSNMMLTYQITSWLIDDATGEITVEDGRWLIARHPLDTVALTVENKADTPVSLQAMLFDEDFDECGTKVRSIFDTNSLDAVRRDAGNKPVVASALMRLAVEGEPIYEQYMGKKHLGVTVRILPVSGVATSGRDFVSPFSA